MFGRRNIWFKIVIFVMIFAMLLSSLLIFLEIFTLPG
jgi:hypothetical protein